MRQRIILALMISVAMAGCQKKASGQTVAVVNDEEITAGELNDALTSDASLTGTDTKQARAAELQKLIDRKLLVQQARRDGVDKSPEFVNQQRRLTEDLLVQMLIGKRLNTKQVPSPDELNRFQTSNPQIFAGREVWTLDQIIYPLPKAADVNKKLGEAKSLDQVAQALTAANIQFQRGTRKLDTAVIPKAIYDQIVKLPAGEPFIANGPGKAVANVISAREPAPVTGDQARSVALNGVRRDEVNTIVQDRVKSLRSSAKITYQPGFEPPKK